MKYEMIVNLAARLGIGALQIINICLDLDSLMFASICFDLGLRGWSKKSRQFALTHTTPYAKYLTAASLLVKAASERPLDSDLQLTAAFYTSLAGINYLLHNDHTEVIEVHTQVNLPVKSAGDDENSVTPKSAGDDENSVTPQMQNASK